MAEKKRSLFEDVDTPATPAPAARRGGLIEGAQGDRTATRRWLLVLFGLVVVMISVGGLTRLTDSGLSITEWAPVSGALPPLSAEAWQSEFDRYRAIPEYQLQNAGMTLAEFKRIYWWEWGHRQLGRFIGLVWAAGFLWLWLSKRVPPGWTGRLLLLGGLGGLQGAIGWWMVSSGLADGMTDVASYRLAVHLGLAFAILGLIAWFVLLLSRTPTQLMTARRDRNTRLFSLTTGLMHVAMLQILIGALVAGIDAGRTYTDWPLMAGRIFPPNAFSIEPVWRNLFENPGLVQFAHRLAGYALLAFGVVVWLRGRRSSHVRTAGAVHLAMAVLALQIVLGVMTVLYAAPWPLAILHQLTAVALWVAIIRARFLAQYPADQRLAAGA